MRESHFSDMLSFFFFALILVSTQSDLVNKWTKTPDKTIDYLTNHDREYLSLETSMSLALRISALPMIKLPLGHNLAIFVQDCVLWTTNDDLHIRMADWSMPSTSVFVFEQGHWYLEKTQAKPYMLVEQIATLETLAWTMSHKKFSTLDNCTRQPTPTELEKIKTEIEYKTWLSLDHLCGELGSFRITKHEQDKSTIVVRSTMPMNGTCPGSSLHIKRISRQELKVTHSDLTVCELRAFLRELNHIRYEGASTPNLPLELDNTKLKLKHFLL